MGRTELRPERITRRAVVGWDGFFSTRAKWRFLKSGCRSALLTTPTLSERRFIAKYQESPSFLSQEVHQKDSRCKHQKKGCRSSALEITHSQVCQYRTYKVDSDSNTCHYRK